MRSARPRTLPARGRLTNATWVERTPLLNPILASLSYLVPHCPSPSLARLADPDSESPAGDGRVDRRTPCNIRQPSLRKVPAGRDNKISHATLSNSPGPC